MQVEHVGNVGLSVVFVVCSGSQMRFITGKQLLNSHTGSFFFFLPGHFNQKLTDCKSDGYLIIWLISL